MKSSPISMLLSAGFGLLLQSCISPSFDPQTGEVSTYAPSSSLVEESNQLFAAMKRTKSLSRNSSHQAQARRVGARLKNVVPTANASWEFVVFQNSEPNAFAMPGGKVGINSGIFSLTKNDAGLAAVLGHEMAHVTLNHTQAKINQAMAINVTTGVLGEVLRARGDPNAAAIAQGAAVAGTLGVILPYSRSAELQADKLGTIYMAKAGYDPVQSLGFWKRMAGWNTSRGTGLPEFLRTHPVDETRIRSLEQFMPTAKRFYRH